MRTCCRRDVAVTIIAGGVTGDVDVAGGAPPLTLIMEPEALLPIKLEVMKPGERWI